MKDSTSQGKGKKRKQRTNAIQEVRMEKQVETRERISNDNMLWQRETADIGKRHERRKGGK